MKCQMCNGEGGKIPHPENYGSYREDCPACNGTGKQPPVDKIQRYRTMFCDVNSDVTQCEPVFETSNSGHWCKSQDVTTLESKLGQAKKTIHELHSATLLGAENYQNLEAELEAARGEIEKKTESIKMLVLDAKRLEDENAQLKAERDGLRCCGNCESSVDNRGQLFCQLKKQDVDINYSCNEWD